MTIAAAVEQQTATTREIGRSVKEAADGTGEIAENIGGVAYTAQQFTVGADDAARAAAELSRLATRLQSVVAEFDLGLDEDLGIGDDLGVGDLGVGDDDGLTEGRPSMHEVAKAIANHAAQSLGASSY
jgi:hypothetical protein